MKVRARALRRNQTDAERRLWSRLRNRQIVGFKFKRQFPIGAYFADFVCLETGLIIEVDGGQHLEQQIRDAVRTEFLERLGYRVLRFWDNDVLLRTDAVLVAIHEALVCPSPAPSPRKRGEGK